MVILGHNENQLLLPLDVEAGDVVPVILLCNENAIPDGVVAVVVCQSRCRSSPSGSRFDMSVPKFIENRVNYPIVDDAIFSTYCAGVFNHGGLHVAVCQFASKRKTSVFLPHLRYHSRPSVLPSNVTSDLWFVTLASVTRVSLPRSIWRSRSTIMLPGLRSFAATIVPCFPMTFLPHSDMVVSCGDLVGDFDPPTLCADREIAVNSHLSINPDSRSATWGYRGNQARGPNDDHN